MIRDIKNIGKKSLSIILTVILSFISYSYALETDTHEEINEYIARNTLNGFSLNSYLKDQLGIQKGIEESFDSHEVWRLMREGGTKEDIPYWYMLYLRSVNHFHNPLTDTGFSGIWGTGFLSGVSSIQWSQKPVGTQSPGGYYSWNDVRGYFYTALTTADKATKDKNFADTFRGLGQLMHLVEDLSVPEHTRDDGHYIFYNYEKWVKEKINKYTIPNYPPIYFDWSAIGNPNPLAPVPIANLFDTNQYNGGNPAITLQNNVGLSEYTNANFFSSDTIFKNGFSYPAWSSVIEYAKEISPGKVRTYLKKVGDGETVNHLAVGKWFYKYLPSNLKQSGVKLDDRVYADYAQKLIPRAVGYSAGLLDYFFRGQMEVTSLPIIDKNKIYKLNLKVKNTTPTGEVMANGSLALACHYTPTGGSPDGSNDIFVSSISIVPISQLGFGNEIETAFYFQDSQIIPIENLSSAKCTIAFQGIFGNEEGAVVGKTFIPGEIKFNEEWDKGLTDNHTWAHTGYNLNQNPANGTTSNAIVNNILIKDNIRYAGYSTGRVNESFVSVYQPLYKDILPITITPNTHIQFKIDNMSINPIPPAEPGKTTHWQGLWLYFNNGLTIQLSLNGQFVYYNPTTAYYTFEPGFIIVDNIYTMFQNYGIAIPEPLYLQGIDFIQQLSVLQQPSDVEHHQHMEVDSIRIVEAKKQQ